MKITEVLSLPTTRSEAWHESWWSDDALYTELFGFAGSWSVDVAAAAAADDRRLTLNEKLSLARDNGRFHASFSVLEFDGSPFAIWFRDGKRGDTSEIIVTDRAVLAAATAHMHSWRTFEEGVRFLEDDPAADVEIKVGGGALVVEDGVTRLVNASHASQDGRLLIRERAVFDAVMAARDADPTLAEEIKAVGLASASVRAVLLAAAAASVPEDLESVTVDDIGSTTDGWTALLVATDEGTYAVGIEAWRLRGRGYGIVDVLSARRVGGPDLIQKYGGVSPRP